MAEFLVEVYVSYGDSDTVGRDVQRMRRAAGELTAEGTPVQVLRSIFVPADETCFFLFEAGSPELVHEAARRASLSCDHVAEAASDTFWKATGH